MICSKCGNNVPGNAKFCSKCGNPMQVQQDNGFDAIARMSAQQQAQVNSSESETVFFGGDAVPGQSQYMYGGPQQSNSESDTVFLGGQQPQYSQQPQYGQFGGQAQQYAQPPQYGGQSAGRSEMSTVYYGGDAYPGSAPQGGGYHQNNAYQQPQQAEVPQNNNGWQFPIPPSAPETPPAKQKKVKQKKEGSYESSNVGLSTRTKIIILVGVVILGAIILYGVFAG